MEPRAKDNIQAARQIPKLKSLLNKYRQVKTMQTGLLQLSELASTVTKMDGFYSALESVISTLLVTDNFHIAIINTSGELTTAYCRNPKETKLLEYLDQQNWRKSLTGIVFERCEPVHCNTAERIALAKAGKIAFYNSKCEDWLGVPLTRGNQVIGVIALQSYDTNLYFDARDSKLLQFIAEHLVTAIDRVRSRELLEKNILHRTQKLTEANEKLQAEIAERQKAENIHRVLLSISEISAAEENLDNFYELLHKEVKKLTSAENLSVFLIDPDTSEHTYLYYSDQKQHSPTGENIAKGLNELAIQKGKPILVQGERIKILDNNRIISSKISVQYEKSYLPKAWLAAPLYNQGNICGVIAIQDYHHEDAYQDSDLQLIQFASQHISTAIMRVRYQKQEQQTKEQLERLVCERTQALQATNLSLKMQIEERRKAEQQLYFEAHHDALTKLPNRAMFLDRLSYSLRHLKRHPLHKFAVLFIDLDRFKVINDTLGHHAGDEFLIEIANRLSGCIRNNDILARLGGDEFVILLDSFQETEDIEDICSRIINTVERPFTLSGNTLYSSASIGIAQCGNHYESGDEILRDADSAMYQAKNLGRGRYVFFDDSMREQLIASMTLEQELRLAIKEKQFELHYQKISGLAAGDDIGYEALLRWNHPSRGLLTPSDFLYLAEETGMIIDIEDWVSEEVCNQLKTWSSSKEYKTASIGVNLSGKYLSQKELLNDLIERFKRYSIEPSKLILEFNENVFSHHGEQALNSLNRLKEFGVKLALDDYGGGMSSLNFLHDYPFEFIKLDRSFVKTLNDDDKNITLVKALHELGNSFGYSLVAEGIESEAVLNKLRSAGCEFGQGYFISRPSLLEQAYTENVTQLKPANVG